MSKELIKIGKIYYQQAKQDHKELNEAGLLAYIIGELIMPKISEIDSKDLNMEIELKKRPGILMAFVALGNFINSNKNYVLCSRIVSIMKKLGFID